MNEEELLFDKIYDEDDELEDAYKQRRDEDYEPVKPLSCSFNLFLGIIIIEMSDGSRSS